MIVKARTGGYRRVPSARSVEGLAEILASQGLAARAGGSVRVTSDGLVGLSAANACIRVAATSVAELSLRVFRGEGLERRPVTTTWQARFLMRQPNPYEAWSLALERTESSLTARNNAYWLKVADRATGQIVAVHVLHPDDVQARWNGAEGRPEYRYRSGVAGSSSSWSAWSTSEVLHFRVGYVDPGCIVAPSPVEIHRDELAAIAAKSGYQADLWGKGVTPQIAVSLDKEVKPEQAERLAARIKAGMSGAGSVGGVRVFGGGATVSTIGLSMADAQFVEAVQADVETMARILGVPASIVGVDKGAKPLTPEHEEIRFERYWLGPRRTRIQDAIGVDAGLFGAGSRDKPELVARPIRGDVRTEAARLHALVQVGILTPDEARAELGYGPHPDGIGAIPQFTPVGGAENPAGLLPAGASGDDA